MKKQLLIILSIMLMALGSLGAFAGVSSYIEPGSLTARSYIIYQGPKLRHDSECNTEIKTDPADLYFLGKARNECRLSNRWNTRCQQRCNDQVKLMARAGTLQRPQQAVLRYGCNIIDDDEALGEIKTASSCYFKAKNACQTANVGNSYCRKKCVQSLYSHCRRNIMTRQRFDSLN